MFGSSRLTHYDNPPGKEHDMKTILKTSTVSVQRGSWKWQQAFAVSTYAPRWTNAGALVWSSLGQSHKMSEPHMRRQGIETDCSGSLHNKPLSEADRRRYLSTMWRNMQQARSTP